MKQGVWLFGYGSIMWKTGFEFDASRPGFISGWARRFWQASTDHRGTPEAPGRVVTLADAPGELCGGLAFRLPRDKAMQIIRALDDREKGGYLRMDVTIALSDGRAVRGMTYRADRNNPYFLGPASNEEIAAQIAVSAGPSGSNTAYLLRLHQALKKHGIHDPHVNAITELVLHNYRWRR